MKTLERFIAWGDAELARVRAGDPAALRRMAAINIVVWGGALLVGVVAFVRSVSR